MPERTADITVGKNASASGKVDFKALPKDQQRARIVDVLERGLVGKRMHVDLPKGLYGEWVHNSKEEIYRMESLGYVIDDKHATSRALHSEGDNKSIVGDVVFMVCDQDTKDLIDAARREQFDRIHGKPGTRKTEETEFAKTVAGQTPLGVVNESRETVVSGSDIKQSLSAAANATT
jgi:hypothetical protein